MISFWRRYGLELLPVTKANKKLVNDLATLILFFTKNSEKHIKQQ